MAFLALLATAGFDGPYASGAPVRQSFSGGGTFWTQVWNASNTVSVHCMTIYNNKLYAGGDYYADVWRYNSNTNWTRINSNGFGDTNNLKACDMEVFNDLLYVGTENGSTGAEVWTYNGSAWSQVNTDGFGAGFPIYECRALTVYDSELYAVASSNGGKFRVYEYISGTTWNQVDTAAWDSANHVGLCAASFGGYLWIGTENTATGTEVWRYDSTTTTWTQANIDGFGVKDLDCECFSVYNSALYCGTWALGGSRGRVYRYSSGTSWTPVSSYGLGDAEDILSLSVFSGKLFAGTTHDTHSGGCQIWSYNGSSWTQEGSGGFGDANNTDATAMTVFNSRLYVGTKNFNGAQVWRDTDTPVPYEVYLAEGSTLWMDNCSEYISIENPNAIAVTVKLTYMVQGAGSVTGPTVSMPANSQATVNPQDIVGRAHFSTKVECLEGQVISADRTMVWNNGPGEEGHCAVGVTAPSSTWYLPEGSSQWGFETWTLVQNPNAQVANVTLTYMTDSGESIPVAHQVPASSRESFNMTSDIGSRDASTMVTSDRPVIPERAMYRDNRREGHDSTGTTTPAQDYYLAEGTTGWGFTTFVLIQNPHGTPTDVTVTYMTSSGTHEESFQMTANSRKTINVNAVHPDLPAPDFSTKVHGSQTIIAERAMYWDNGTGEACHDSIGMAAAHTNFYLPDGQTDNGRETWTLVQNPNSSDVTVEISYLRPDGTGNVVKTETIPANTRRTYSMYEHSGISGRAAIKVHCLTSGKKIMVERAMYWNARGAGTDTIGGYAD
jgi:hypothetical protein